MFRVGILTVSDKGHAGERHDASGPELARLLDQQQYEVKHLKIVPDEHEAIVEALVAWSDEENLDLILTTGGTGFTPRDITPEATLAVAERLAPGIPEAMRAAGLTKTPHAMLSRGVAVLRGGTLIINLPGSPKGARESLEAILAALPHALEKLKGSPAECGTP
jgi:molybdenum cofactor synthesis domain-containing protein